MLNKSPSSSSSNLARGAGWALLAAGIHFRRRPRQRLMHAAPQPKSSSLARCRAATTPTQRGVACCQRRQSQRGAGTHVSSDIEGYERQVSKRLKRPCLLCLSTVWCLKSVKKVAAVVSSTACLACLLTAQDVATHSRIMLNSKRLLASQCFVKLFMNTLVCLDTEGIILSRARLCTILMSPCCTQSHHQRTNMLNLRQQTGLSLCLVCHVCYNCPAEHLN